MIPSQDITRGQNLPTIASMINKSESGATFGPVITNLPPAHPNLSQLQEGQLEFLTNRLAREVSEHNSTKAWVQHYLGLYLKHERAFCSENAHARYQIEVIDNLRRDVKVEKDKRISAEHEKAFYQDFQQEFSTLDAVDLGLASCGRTDKDALGITNNKDLALRSANGNVASGATDKDALGEPDEEYLPDISPFLLPLPLSPLLSVSMSPEFVRLHDAFISPSEVNSPRVWDAMDVSISQAKQASMWVDEKDHKGLAIGRWQPIYEDFSEKLALSDTELDERNKEKRSREKVGSKRKRCASNSDTGYCPGQKRRKARD